MSDPLKDYTARKRQQEKESVRKSHTPIVLWVESDIRSQQVINYLHEELEALPGIEVATNNAPYKYAASGVLREEEADGNGSLTTRNDE
jgi:hypothetical protein